ncbi:hypothetical protein C0995_015527 [Termitomyces sp. Mi166|nr:hypothetical protein C0995_015527 [Termitomyces sp. Mi166\
MQAELDHRSSQVIMRSPTAQQTLQMPDAIAGDLYTYNSLQSFSFGSAQPQQSTSRPVHPLSSVHGDGDNIGEDLRFEPSDVTPRPSVVAYEQHNQQRSHTTQQVSEDLHVDRTQSGGDPGRPVTEPDVSSRPGFSSASASVTSLSSTGGDYLRSRSRASQNSSSTNQTSAEQSLVADSDNDRHRHPLPYTSNTAVEFSSDEEFGDSEYDYDYYDEEGMRIEIGSTQYEGSIATRDWDREFYLGASNGSDSIRSGFSYTERRGSIPIAIPGTPPVNDSSVSSTGRNREDSLATLRRPSRSLDDDLVKLGLTRSPPSGQSTTGHQLQPSPVSVPSSDGDWRLLEERNRTRGMSMDVERDPKTLASPSSSQNLTRHASDLTSAAAAATAMDDFDLDWAQMQRGITGLDPTALGDIVGSSDLTPGSNDCRPSATGEGGAKWLLSWTREERRPSAATVSSYGGDTFGKAIRDWDGPSYQAQRRDWSFKKENGDTFQPSAAVASKSPTGSILSPRGSTVAERSTPGHVGSGEQSADKEKRSASAVWKGMRPNTYEIWGNDRLGRFKVERRVLRATNENKGPQQRLSIVPIKYPNGGGVSSDGPPVTIHKHSKAVAFSISRHYRSPRKRGDIHPTSSHSTDLTLNGLPGGLSPTSKRGSSMILLAPRRVQEAYTSTTTTRKLESHGLLDDPAASRPQDGRDKERHRWQKEREDQRQTQRVKKGRERIKANINAEETKGNGKVKQQGRDDSHIPTASGTLVQPFPPPTSAPSIHTYPPSSASSSSALVKHEAGTPEYPISRNSSHHSRRRRVRDPLDDDDGDEDDNENPPPTRTPHSEAFGTMDATLIEQLRQDRFNGDSEKGGLWNRLVGRGNHSVTASPAQLHAPFVAPWLALQPRNKQESHQVVIDTLNDSFKDVGLLPSNYNTSRHAVPTSQRQKKIAGSHNNNDPFKQIPEDALYMLLPLWPGDTDARSEVLSASFGRPVMHNRHRQYLLVYYKAPPEEEHHKTDKDNKKRLRSSPTSSYDSATRREDRASVLLTSFHITARLVPYQKLQGTGVRVPDEGLTVTGLLKTAFAHIPPLVNVDENYYEYVLGICHSRDAGIEFYPDGLVKMGLCEQSEVPLPVSTSEEDTFPEPELKLTPIGRAVLEMIWSGALALTSFGTNA